MGLSLNTCHIYNAERLTKAQFKKAFCEYMKSKGYTTATEDTAELSYALVFSKDRRWVTVLSEDEADPRSASAEYAKSLGTYAVMIELVDSDFAELSLFDETGAHIDTLTLGESYLEEAAQMGEPSAWQPLMVGSWEQVEAIQNGSYTFAEEAVSEFAPVIGMDGENVLLDNDSKVDEKNAITLYFKTAKEKKLTLKTAFIKYFGEILLPIGFEKVTINKQPYFLRVVNGEILQILTYQQVSARKIGFKTFEICYGIKTLYRGFIDPEYDLGYFLTKDPSLYDEELVSRAVDYSVKFWNKEKIGKLSYEFSRISYHFNPDFLTGMEIGRDIVAQGLVPIFEKTKNLENCIDYFYENRQSINFLLDDDRNPEKFMPSHNTSEALALIVADYRKDISEYLERELEFELRTHGLKTEKEFEALKLRFYDEKKMQINLRDRILDTPELKAKALDYAESVRQKNVELLRSYGMKI